MARTKKKRSEAKNQKHFINTVKKTGKWRGKKAEIK